MAEVELVEEDVEGRSGAGLGEAVALALRRDDDVLVDDEPAPLEPRPHVPPLVAARREIDVGQVSLHLLEELDVRGTVETVGQGAENPELEPLFAGVLDEVESAVHVLEVLNGHYEYLRRCSSTACSKQASGARRIPAPI